MHANHFAIHIRFASCSSFVAMSLLGLEREWPFLVSSIFTTLMMVLAVGLPSVVSLAINVCPIAECCFANDCDGGEGERKNLDSGSRIFKPARFSRMGSPFLFKLNAWLGKYATVHRAATISTANLQHDCDDIRAVLLTLCSAKA